MAKLNPPFKAPKRHIFLFEELLYWLGKLMGPIRFGDSAESKSLNLAEFLIESTQLFYWSV